MSGKRNLIAETCWSEAEIPFEAKRQRETLTPETKNPEICPSDSHLAGGFPVSPSESPPCGRGPGLVLEIWDFMVRLAAPLHYSNHRIPADD